MQSHIELEAFQRLDFILSIKITFKGGNAGGAEYRVERREVGSEVQLQSGGSGVELMPSRARSKADEMLGVGNKIKIHSGGIVFNARLVNRCELEVGSGGICIQSGFTELNAGSEVVYASGQHQIRKHARSPLVVPSRCSHRIGPGQSKVDG